MKAISIIIPVYNEEKSIYPLYKALSNFLTNSTEVIFVDDGSFDQTPKLIELLTIEDKRVRLISLSRNYGHQIAILAGTHKASGDIIITMDGDLQHPPSLIPQLINKIEEGFDIASARRISTKNYSTFKSYSSNFFYKIQNFLSNTKIEPNVADFRAFNKKVQLALFSFNENNLFLRGIFNWIGFNQCFVDYEISDRSYGDSKYSFRKMFRLSLDGIMSFTIKPLRIAIYTGLIFSVVGFLFGVYALYEYYNGNTIQGWTSSIIITLFIGGIQILMIGVLGEYVGKTFLESKKRPIYLIKKVINLAPTAAS